MRSAASAPRRRSVASPAPIRFGDQCDPHAGVPRLDAAGWSTNGWRARPGGTRGQARTATTGSHKGDAGIADEMLTSSRLRRLGGGGCRAGRSTQAARKRLSERTSRQIVAGRNRMYRPACPHAARSSRRLLGRPPCAPLPRPERSVGRRNEFSSHGIGRLSAADRRTRTAPRSASRRRMRWLSGGWAMPSRSAPRPKCNSSATATKYRSWRSWSTLRRYRFRYHRAPPSVLDTAAGHVVWCPHDWFRTA